MDEHFHFDGRDFKEYCLTIDRGPQGRVMFFQIASIQPYKYEMVELWRKSPWGGR